MSDDVFLPATQQLLALTTLMSVVVGALRAKGLLTEQDVADLFNAADQMLPDKALPHGAELLAVVKGTQAHIQGGSAEC